MGLVLSFLVFQSVLSTLIVLFAVFIYYFNCISSDVVLETMVLVLRRLEDKNEGLGLGS